MYVWRYSFGFVWGLRGDWLQLSHADPIYQLISLVWAWEMAFLVLVVTFRGMDELNTQDGPFSVVKSNFFFFFLILGYTKTAINNNTQIWAPPKNNFIQWCHNMEYEKRNPSVELWHLNSALWALTLDPPSFVRGWEPEKKRLWGKIRNLLPQLALISPCWAYFIPTHKQSLVHRRRRGKTQMKDACWTTGCCWDRGSLSDNEPHLSVSFCLGKFVWNSPWIDVVLLDLMLFWK